MNFSRKYRTCYICIASFFEYNSPLKAPVITTMAPLHVFSLNTHCEFTSHCLTVAIWWTFVSRTSRLWNGLPEWGNVALMFGESLFSSGSVALFILKYHTAFLRKSEWLAYSQFWLLQPPYFWWYSEFKIQRHPYQQIVTFTPEVSQKLL